MLIYLIIAVNIVVSLIGFSSMKAGNSDKFLFVPYSTARGEGMTGMVLSNFSHSGFGHLFFNMISFWFFAPVLKPEMQMLLPVYFVSTLGSLALIFALRRNDPNYRCLGASGSITGVIFAAIVMNPAMTVYFYGIPIPGPLFAVGYLGISIYFMKAGRDGISHEAHIGGAIAGFAAAAFLNPAGLAPLTDRIKGLIGM